MGADRGSVHVEPGGRGRLWQSLEGGALEIERGVVEGGGVPSKAWRARALPAKPGGRGRSPRSLEGEGAPGEASRSAGCPEYL